MPTKPSIAVRENLARIHAIMARHSLKTAKIFGSTARGQDSDTSDIDVLVEPTDRTSLMDLARLKIELEDLLGVKVDVTTKGALSEDVASSISRDLKPLYP
jgi:predicted nucleotidyltransferase